MAVIRQEAQSLYIHIPFCSQICYYCDFAKVLIQHQPVDDYLQALLAELDAYQVGKLKTLYIGGGTPTALSNQQLTYLLKGLNQRLDIKGLVEFTVEANPGDLDQEKINSLVTHGVNRVSLGVQTFNDRMLKKIGRSHSRADVLNNIIHLRAAGISNISIDLIYALPGQTMADLEDDLTHIQSLNLPHVALYSLILENHTLFMNRMRQGKLDLPSESEDADMYMHILSALDKMGYSHYEVSNFTKPGFESQHNLSYWDNVPYYGIGAGASGYLDGVRYKNHGPIKHYLKAKNKRVTEEVLDKQAMMEEELFLGLRKAAGISISHFKAKFDQDFDDLYGQVVDNLQAKGLLNRRGDQLCLTDKGFLLGNDVFSAFLLD